MNNPLTPERTRTFLGVLGGAVAIMVIFEVGVLAGGHRFEHHRRFGSPSLMGPFGFHGGMPHLSMMGGHGVVGEVASIALPKLVVAERDGEQATILVASTTEVREVTPQGDERSIVASDIQTGEFIVVLGQPSSSDVIEADLIRVVPPPPGEPTTTTSTSSATSATR